MRFMITCRIQTTYRRIQMVEEWNTNQEYYQGFLTVDITTITHEFLQSGHAFLGCLGGSDGCIFGSDKFADLI